jgi:hypothetical protein
VKKTIWMACALVLPLTLWALGQAGAASRCHPNKRFVVLSGELVSDALTGLTWQQKASSNTMNWAQAHTYCPAGFRLPTVKELSSIVDFRVAYPGPAIDQIAFPNTPAEEFWTSSQCAGDITTAWYVSFAYGASVWNSKDLSFRVRCVR